MTEHLPLCRYLMKWTKKAEDGCWIWEGAKTTCGYGVCSIRSAGELLHRLSYEIFYREIPAHTIIHHTCENRACWNPAHLEAMTQSEHVILHNEASASRARTRRRF